MQVKSESEVAQSCPTLVTPWTVAYQAPPSMGFSRQKYWSGVPLPSPTPPRNPPWYLLLENAPLIISLSNMLVLPERVPLKALKGFEGIWLQNQFHI